MVRSLPTRRLSERPVANTSRSSSPSAAASLVTPRRSSRSRSRTKMAALEPEKSINVAATVEEASSSGLSSKTASSVVSPNRSASEDELSTPPTTDANTPGSYVSADGQPKQLLGFQPASSLLRLEIELPDRPSRAGASLASDSVKALSRSKYSLNSKRKRNVVDDSDVGEDEEEDEGGANAQVLMDAQLARQLQREEDKHKSGLPAVKSEAVAGPSSRPGLRGRPLQTAGHGVNEEDPSWLSGSDSSDAILMLPTDAWDDPAPAKKRKLTRAAKSSGPAKRTAAKTSAAEPLVISDDSDGSSVLSDIESLESLLDEYSDVDSYVSGEEALEIAASRAGRGGTDMNALGTRRQYRDYRSKKRAKNDRGRLEDRHPVLKTMWQNLEATPVLRAGRADQPMSISRNLKPFQLEGLAWMTAMEKTDWKGGLLGDEMGLGKTIQAVSLIMSDYPAKKPTLVLVPPVALMQWTSEIASYTDGCLKTFIFHGTNAKTKGMTVKDVKKYDVILMSYNSLESMYRKQEKGFNRKEGVYKEKSIIHQTSFHRVILDEAHCIKTRSTMTAKACFALNVDYRWCLTGTPLQNRIGEFFSLLRFLQIEPFANYVCRDCDCSKMEWSVDDDNLCTVCKHRGMRHLSVFNQELLNPIQRYGNFGPGKEAFRKLRILTDRVMLRRLKKDHTDSMELPVKDIVVDRQFFSEVETDFANSIMTNSQRKFTTYVENGVMLNNYANIFGLIMQMRQVADHPDLILKKNSEGSQNVMFCCICDEPAEEAIRSKCKHDFCRECAKNYLHATEQPDCPRCHIPLSIDLEQPEMEQDELMVKKSSIINRIRMANWTSSSKIELLVHNLYRLRSDKASHKSIIFSQFTTMLQLIEWRLRRAGITTVMLDGSMTPAQRQASIEYFKNNVDVECFLVSLKAGGVALNLTEASRVFIVDPWWNPAAEWQSADRCHRIGQTRPCIVTRLCIEDSVESRMVLLQEKKTRMINSTINSDDAAMESLTPEDLQFLFRGS